MLSSSKIARSYPPINECELSFSILNCAIGPLFFPKVSNVTAFLKFLYTLPIYRKFEKRHELF